MSKTLPQLSDILGKKILMVTAHPDDESFLAAGLLTLNAGAGGKNFLLCATLGERGRKHLDAECTDEELKKIRRQELENAARTLNISLIEVANFADCSLEKHIDQFSQHAAQTINSRKPDIILGFGPDGYTGHSDHAAAFLAASSAAESQKLSYLAAALPPTPLCDEYLQHLCKKRSHENYHERSNPSAGEIQVQIDGAKKIQALMCHSSQWKGLDPHKIFPQHLAEHFLQFEYFKLC